MTTRPTQSAAHATPRRGRSGVTLIELLVVMAIITALGLLALMLLPGITNSDAALKATEEVRSQVKVAQALAGASRQPRGIRFLTNPANLNNPLAATELQLLEAPPVMAIDPLALVAGAGVNGANGVNGPYVELEYILTDGTEDDPSNPGAKYQPGIIVNIPTRTPPSPRHCYVRRLTLEQRAQVQPGALLALPTLGAWSRINTRIGFRADGITPTPDPDEIELEIYPDAQMGAAAQYRTYHAGIYGVPIPLLGQPTIPLPKDIAVDLEVSVPAPRVNATTGAQTLPYDVMFAPDGQTISINRQANNSGVYLWVRDITKIVNPNAPAGSPLRTRMKWTQTPATPGPPPTYTNGPEFATVASWVDAFRLGGEHHAVVINNGAVGTSPIQWPAGDGRFPEGPERVHVFAFARKKLN